MGLHKTVEKLDEYLKRLDQGQVQKIKPSHVEKVIRKLEAKKALLLDELAETGKPDKRERLQAKLGIVHDQLERAHWLQGEIGKPEGSGGDE
ncbi:hypothetical protein EI983_12575 [Roseovarius faecimaris]|uniref:DUF465 domain-containing protein n=1 Tax=Roseovarius faecimaris TaxID=2494550 RepID=A0A6I6IU89_9RHOB|nr:hypothetical protein [Roseovarius faecimaris]QGX99057.1 hypothetical protein EI983_12575 [Roseovarius faecimaris]